MPDAIQPEFSRKTRVSDLRRDAPRPVDGEADAAERAALATRFGAVALPQLSFTAEISPWRGGWRVSGVVRARVTQACVVTLEEVDQVIEEPFARLFAPDAPAEPSVTDIDPEADDPPEELGDFIDLGEIAVETAALALDPYPRAPGAVLPLDSAAPEGAEPLSDAEAKPFSALASLRDRLTSGRG